ncbi:MAG: C25 family cysteine peptidase [Candidatus Marinimicrobia bacterium]|nr:C25 family cysteine peptidase [Candidatus Neomarinimicrobiota bacterium]
MSLILGSSIAMEQGSGQLSEVSEIARGVYRWHLNMPAQAHIKLNNSGIEFPNWNTTVDGNGYLVPVLSKLIHTASGPPDIQVVNGVVRSLAIARTIESVSEQAKGLDISTTRVSDQMTGWVMTRLIRDEDDHQLWVVNVLGAQYDGVDHQWKIPEYLTVSIASNHIAANSALESDLYLNQIQKPDLQQVNSIQTGLGQGQLKLYTLADGIYRIHYDSLASIEDFPDDQIQSRSLKIIHKGEEQAIYVNDSGDGVFESGDYFDFIGTQNYFSGTTQYFDPFSDINVYWLNWGGTDGLRFIEESGALVDQDPVRPTTFWDVTHIEEDLLFDRLGQVDVDLPTITRDHYFWNSVNSGSTKEIDFFLADPFRGSSENIQVSIGLHGLTYSDTATAAHTIFAFLNDISIGSGSWTQQEAYILASPQALNLSHNILADGNNVLATFIPASTQAGNYDRVVVNWLEIGYEHLLVTHNNRLTFRKSYINPSTNLEFEIKGFTSHDLVLYKEGLSRITGYNIRENWDSETAEFSLVFQDQASDATPDYWTASVESLLKPVRIVVDTSASLREQDGDLIIITIPEFEEELEEYIAFKVSEGWDPIVVSVADIYDEFNWGINSPYAIRSFLQYANNQWPSSPEYVLLIGDAIANPQQAKRDTRLRNVPTFYMQTYGWGAAEADYWYSLINGNDYLPDLNIGRIPCSSIEDLGTTITKLIGYGQGDNYGSWQNELITIAGFENTFKTQSELLLRNNIPKSFMPSRIFIDRDSEGQIFWGDTDSLVAQWNEGKMLINFLGHGGGAVWADRSLFVRDDIQYLDEETPPAFITSMTCFTASFAQTRGLGEVVLTESPTGAIGWFGSSGVGWVINDYLMVQPLLRHLLEDRTPVGKCINVARMEYFLANSGYNYLKPSMLFQYNFLGDPTTRLLLPESQELISSEKMIYSQTDQIDLHYTGNQTGTLKLLPIDADGHPWWSGALSYDTDNIHQYLFNQESEPPSGESRTIYTLDRGADLSAIQGYASYSISANWFEHQSPTAAELEAVEHIPLNVQFHSSPVIPVDSLVVTFSGNHGSYNLEWDGDWWSLPDTVRILAGNSNITYSFTVYMGGLFIQNSATFRLYLPESISLTLSAIREGVEANRCGWLLEYSLQGLQQAVATLEHHETAPGFEQTIVNDVPIREGNNTIFIPSFFGSGPVEINVSLLLEDDSNLNDNNLQASLTPTHFQLLPEIGISFNGQTTDSISMWSDGVLYANAADTAWIRISQYQNNIEALPGVNLYQDSTVYLIETVAQDLPIRIKSAKALFLKDPDLAAWQILATTGQEYQLHGQGYVAMGVKQNSDGPDVSMMIEGQMFFDGDYILANSRLNLLAEDENGFSWKSGDVEIMVDATPVTVQMGDTTETARIISMSAALDMTVGEHQISYRVQDALGNWSDRVEVSGVVAGGAKIIDYGNFPNPFEGETLIIFELTQPLSNVVIEIFTISGYKLHSIDGFNARVSIPLGAIGYHEVPWNGRDRNDDFVANGVYFYRIKGDLDDDVLVGPVGKMVKNR